MCLANLAYLIIQRAIHADAVNTGGCLQRPVVGLHSVAGIQQLFLFHLASPVLLEGGLHLALRADPGEACKQMQIQERTKASMQGQLEHRGVDVDGERARWLLNAAPSLSSIG